MNTDSLIQYYIQQELEKQQNQATGNDSSLSKIKQLTNKANSFGSGVSSTGNFLQENVNNELASKLGSSMTNFGNNITNGATAVNNVLNAPSNYFKGFANRALSKGLSGVGTSLAKIPGVVGKIGASMAGAGAGTAAGAGAATGAATGASAAGAGAAAGAGTAAAGTGAAASGAAAGGAAAGGSAASGAAAAGPIGALVALGIMAAAGTNRKRAKKGGEQLLNTTNQMATNRQKNNLETTQQTSEALQQAAQQNLISGTMTGGAAAVQPAESNPITEYQDYLRQNGYSDEIVNGVPQGLNGGNKDIADWITQYNNGAAGQANPIRIPQTPEEIEAAKAGNFTNSMQIGGIDKTQTAKDTILSKFANGLGDFAKGYKENRTTAFDANNLMPDDSKGKMTRFGEAAGTMARVLQNPALQGLVAGGLSTALTGNPLYGLGQGYKFANQRATNNLYQDTLAKNGIQVDPGMFSNLDSTDMNALMMPHYKEMENDIKKIYYDTLAEYRAGMLKNAEEKTKIDKKYKEGRLANDTKKAEAAIIKANNAGSGKGKTPKPQDNPDWGEDLAGYTQRLTNPRYAAQIPNMKAAFIKKYGVDPDKYIKL